MEFSHDEAVDGTEGSVGFALIGVAMLILGFVLIRNEGRRALSIGQRRRSLQLILGGLAALIGLGLIVVGILGLVTS